jgi:hypothetical protein
MAWRDGAKIVALWPLYPEPERGATFYLGDNVINFLPAPEARNVIAVRVVSSGISEEDRESLVAILFPGPTLLSLVGLFAVFLIIDGGDCCRRGRGMQERTLGISYIRGHRRHRGGASGHGLARPYGVRLCRSPRGVGPNTSLDIHPPGRQSKPTIIRATKLHNASVIRSAFVDVRGTWQGQ